MYKLILYNKMTNLRQTLFFCFLLNLENAANKSEDSEGSKVSETTCR